MAWQWGIKERAPDPHPTPTLTRAAPLFSALYIVILGNYCIWGKDFSALNWKPLSVNGSHIMSWGSADVSYKLNLHILPLTQIKEDFYPSRVKKWANVDLLKKYSLLYSSRIHCFKIFTTCFSLATLDSCIKYMIQYKILNISSYLKCNFSIILLLVFVLARGGLWELQL